MILTERNETVAGMKTHLLTGGTGMPILLLHGWGSAAERFRDILARLPDDIGSVIAVDLPGFGGSDRPPDTWGIRDYARWVESLLQSLGQQRPIVVGHSFGGSIAIVLAGSKPNSVRGLILMAAGHLTPRNETKLSAFRALAASGKRLLGDPERNPLAKNARKLLYRLAGSKDALRAGPMQPIFRRVIEERVNDDLSRITVPTIVLWGDRDEETPMRDAEEIVSNVSGAELRVLPDVGHAPHREQPVQFSLALENALRDLQKRIGPS